MRTAIVCNTPYQVLNALNLVFNEKSFGKVDLLLINRFRNATELFSKLSSLMELNRVYLIEPMQEIPYSKRETLLRLLNPKHNIQQYMMNKDCECLNAKYDAVFFGDLEPIARVIVKNNPKIEQYFLDDGAASYYGDALNDCKSKKLLAFERMFKLGTNTKKMTAMYVNGADICKSSISDKIVQLPKYDESNAFIDKAKVIFNYIDSENLKTHKYIILDYPMVRIPEYNGLDICRELSAVTDNILMRFHPCSEMTELERVHVDREGNLWELCCINDITNNHVLISYFSTSQLMPKIISGKEPYLIFLYKIMLNKEGEYRFGGYEKVVEMIRGCYNHKHKIYIPSTVEEFVAIIKGIQANR